MAQKAYDSKREDYKTPAVIYKTILDFIRLLNFDLDVCCSDSNVPAKVYVMKDKALNAITGNYLDDCGDGLKTNWWGTCFMNPPFRPCRHWVKKAVEEVKKNKCEVWAVLPTNRCETLFFQKNIFNNPNCMFAFLPNKQGFIIPGQEDVPPIPSQGILIACFSKRAAERQYCWNIDKKLFNTTAFLGGENV